MRETAEKNGVITNAIKGAAASVILTIAVTLLFALFAKLFSFSVAAYKPVNQFIKVTALVMGAIIGVREKKGLLKGALIGAANAAVTLLLYRVVGGENANAVGILAEFGFQIAVGAVAGVLAVNLKKEK